MKRLCVFAHWDRDNIIDEYVVYYLNAIKFVCDKIIFVSDCDLPEDELSKISELVDYSIAQKHGEYDFGSYKRGFLLSLEKQLDYDELLFVNDSCYGPFYPLESIFEKMSKKKCDFWGLTENKYGIDKFESKYKIVKISHIQSYFILLKKDVFTSSVFLDFINNVKAEKNKDDIIINYEIGLSKLLYKNGFKSASFISSFMRVKNPTINLWDKLILKYNFPLLKTEIVKRGVCILGPIYSWRQVIPSVSDYPIEYIEKNFERLQNLFPNLYSSFNLYRKIRFRILQNLPYSCTTSLINFEKAMYPILNKICFNKLKKF